MLAEIYIRNFAIIEELRLPFVVGFNVLTGETGAGKSIILDAMMLILGGRADKSMVRANTKKATIEAIFHLSAEIQTALAPILNKEGLDGEGEEELMVVREVRTNGRTVARVNGSAVGVKLLQQIGEHLIDIHGQGSHLKLLRAKSHLPLLDSYANVEAERAAVSDAVRKLRVLQAELADLQRDERILAQRVDLLSFQVQEIDGAGLRSGEQSELRGERSRLGNAEQLMKSSALVSALLLGVDDDAPAVIDLLGSAERALGQLARLDDTQDSLLERMQGLVSELNELAGDVDDYNVGLFEL
ncbi:MAG: AAA family ATPase, partial [Candidatus Promineifilaceae bacterium]